MLSRAPLAKQAPAPKVSETKPSNSYFSQDETAELSAPQFAYSLAGIRTFAEGENPEDSGHHFANRFANRRLPFPIQAKLIVGAVNDPLETEADRVADEVMRMPASQAAVQSLDQKVSAGTLQKTSADNSLHRKCDCGGTCDDCKTQDKKDKHDEHAKVQMKAAGHGVTGGFAAPPIVHEVLRSSGQPLDSATRAFMEPRFGHDFSRVRIHTDARAAESARAVGARAYAVGRNVVFGLGEYRAGTGSGQRLMGHELAHVVQQGSGSILQRKPEEPKQKGLAASGCPAYEQGELGKSKQDPGILGTPVALIAPDKLLIADFGVNWRHLKPSVQRDPLLRSWMTKLKSAAKLEIVGFSDCVGDEADNNSLRTGRARRVSAMLRTALAAHPQIVAAAPSGSFVTTNVDKVSRAKNRGVTVTAIQPENTATPKSTPATAPVAPLRQGCFDGKIVSINKNNRTAACPAFTSASAPTPEGTFCLRPQGEAQLGDSILHPFRPSRSHWYLMEPQFNTPRSRMDLHPGSISVGCVTVTDFGCFNELEAVLNSGGSSSGYGYDGYPPGNSEGVKNPRKDVDCVALLQVGYKQGACGDRASNLRATGFEQCLKEEFVPVSAGAEAAEAAANDVKMKCYQKTGFMFWAEHPATGPFQCTDAGCLSAPALEDQGEE